MKEIEPSCSDGQLRPPHKFRTPYSQLSAARLSVPDPGGFNGSLINRQGRSLLAYRTTHDMPSLACCYVDEALRVVPGSHRPIPLHCSADPRLVEFHGDIYLVTSYFGSGLDQERIELRRLMLDDRGLDSVELVAVFDQIYKDPSYNKRREKNWAPFSYEDELYFVHRMRPHRILRYDPMSRRVSLLAETDWSVPDSWTGELRGELRLNTNAVWLGDGTYLSTFHTCVPELRYFNGFYRFDGKPPFRVIEVSPLPVLHPADATGSNARSHCGGVVFPLSLFVDPDRRAVRLTGGDNDHSVVVIDLELNKILDEMVSVEFLP